MPLYVFEILFECESMVMCLILRAIDQRNHAATHVLREALNGLRVAAELLKVTISKLDPL